MKKLHYIWIKPVNQAKFYKDGRVANHYLYYPDIVNATTLFFAMTPSDASAILQYGIYDTVDVLLTERNMTHYEGEGEPGSLTGWVKLNNCLDGEKLQ